MKRLGFGIFLFALIHPNFAQHRNGTLVASTGSTDRIAIVRNSLNIPAWHEKNFWPVYEEYLKTISEYSTSSSRSLNDLAEIEKDVNDQEALENGRKMLGSRLDVLTVRQRYYSQIASAFNGIIALEFLQTEALIDMVESSSIYEGTNWRNFRFHPNAMNPKQINSAKHNVIKAALEIPENRSKAFWEVYKRYEEECDALLGEDYNMIALYSGEPSDFTPALAKRLGNDFINVMERELKLKEKYFEQMNLLVGSSLAARFLAWEDYYSLVSKMHAWAEN